jgi:hypothetical protein
MQLKMRVFYHFFISAKHFYLLPPKAPHPLYLIFTVEMLQVTHANISPDLNLRGAPVASRWLPSGSAVG